VTAIELPQNNLVGRVAGLLYHLPHLKILNLRFADAEASGLEILNLAGNSMTNIDGIGGEPEFSFQCLTRLSLVNVVCVNKTVRNKLLSPRSQQQLRKKLSGRPKRMDSCM